MHAWRCALRSTRRCHAPSRGMDTQLDTAPLQVVDLQLLHATESRMGEEDVVTVQIVPFE